MARSARLSALLGASVCLLAASAVEAAMSAWWTDLGPSLILQRNGSNNIYYSLCNSQKQPTFTTDGLNVLPVSKPAKEGSALAGTGWYDAANGYTVASLFYQGMDDVIQNSLLHCDPQTGEYFEVGSYSTSSRAPSIHPQTGLAAVLLGSTTGYRVYYHDLNRAVNSLGYTPNTDWDYYGIVSQDNRTSRALAAAFSQSQNITMVVPRENNIEVARLYSDRSWHISTFPQPLAGNLSTNATNSTTESLFAVNATAPARFTLPAWTGSPSGLGISIDKSFNRSVFYIGSDRKLYQVTNANSTWNLQPNQTADIWPLADNANGELAVIGDAATDDLRIYYMSNSTLTEVKKFSGAWSAASAVPTANLTSTSTSSGSASASAGASSGLSTGAKAGIGVGVSLGVIALAGMLGAFFFLRRRQRKKDEDAAAAAAATAQGHGQMSSQWGEPHTPAPTYSSVGGTYFKPEEKDGISTYGSPHQQVGELDTPRPVFEMENTNYSHELMGEGHYREVHGDAIFTPQTPSGHGISSSQEGYGRHYQ